MYVELHSSNYAVLENRGIASYEFRNFVRFVFVFFDVAPTAAVERTTFGVPTAWEVSVFAESMGIVQIV